MSHTCSSLVVVLSTLGLHIFSVNMHPELIPSLRFHPRLVTSFPISLLVFALLAQDSLQILHPSLSTLCVMRIFEGFVNVKV